MAKPRNSDRLENWIASYEESGIPAKYRNRTYASMLQMPPFAMSATHYVALARIEAQTEAEAKPRPNQSGKE